MGYLESIIGFVVIFGCGLGLYLFGLRTGSRSDKPIVFWANGEPLDPDSVKDIPSYNRAFGKLFRLYSIPCMLSGVSAALSVMDNLFIYISFVILIFWGTIGLYWLISSYKKMEKQFIMNRNA